MRARLLRFPAVTFVAVAIGIALCLPVLRCGFFADDYFQLLALGPQAGDHSPLDLYRFTGRDAAESARIFARGPWPWFGDPAVHAGFFRPLSSALLLLDHTLFGVRPLGWHVHSLLWYAALVAAVAALYRRAAPEGAAALALMLFATSYTHALPVGWIASRHALVAAVPAALGLLAHIRGRQAQPGPHRAGWRPGRWLGVAAFGVGLAGGETALAMLAYVFTYELFGRTGPLRERGRALAPYAALAAVYLGVYKALGYGVRGSSMYLDPLGDPAQFAAQLPGRFAALSAGQLLGAPSDFWMFDARSRAPLAAIGAVAIVAFALVLRSASRTATDEERRALRFWLAGAVLALVAVLSGTIGNRLLVAPGIGAFVAIAFALRHAWRVARKRIAASPASRAALTFTACILGFVHVVASPPLLAATIESLRRQGEDVERIAGGPGVVPAPGSHVIVIAAASPIPALFGGAYRMHSGEPRAEGWHVLSFALHDHRLTRSGPRTLELEVLGGRMLEGELDAMMRRSETPLAAGHEAPLDCGRVRVLEAPDGQPTRIEITFDHDIEGPAYSFLVLDEGAFRPVALPAQGGSIVIGIHPANMPF
jgi:hypothetical protein